MEKRSKKLNEHNRKYFYAQYQRVIKGKKHKPMFEYYLKCIEPLISNMYGKQNYNIYKMYNAKIILTHS